MNALTLANGRSRSGPTAPVGRTAPRRGRCQRPHWRRGRNGTRDTVQSHGGTSASASIWAALIALADQYAGRHLGFINPAINQIARSPHYHQAFHDITTGNNTVQFPPTTITGYQAAPGWDPVTGWGSPNAQVLIPLLALLQPLNPGPRSPPSAAPTTNRPARGPGPPHLRSAEPPRSIHKSRPVPDAAEPPRTAVLPPSR